MIQKIKTIVASAALLFAFGSPALISASAYAATDGDVIGGGLNCGSTLDVSSATSGTSGTSATCATADEAGTGDKLNGIIKLVINIFSLVVGVVAVIMIIIGGLKYITSGGDSGNVTGAKHYSIRRYWLSRRCSVSVYCPLCPSQGYSSVIIIS